MIAEVVQQEISKQFSSADVPAIRESLATALFQIILNDNILEIVRVQLAVLQLSKGQMNLFENALETANADWRDVLVASGLDRIDWRQVLSKRGVVVPELLPSAHSDMGMLKKLWPWLRGY